MMDKVQIKRVSKCHTLLSKFIYLLMVSSFTIHMKNVSSADTVENFYWAG